jgi:hypothetical protein
MKPNFKFDHQSDELHKALGIDESVLENLSKKMANLHDLLEDGEPISVSHILEKFDTLDLSNEELHILAATEVKNSIVSAQRKMMKLLSKLKDIKNLDDLLKE